VPVNAVGDFGGGGMLLAFGMLAGILSARRTGKGQVIDCAMVDGAALVSALTWSLKAAGMWKDERGTNLLDTGAPYYDVYRCADGNWVAIGALEPHFFAVLKEKLGLSASQHDPNLREELRARFLAEPRAHWDALLSGTDSCYAPVMNLAEAPGHPHLTFRGTFANIRGYPEPAPAPRFEDPPC
jgi:alpha-methylacyl-CoA racemase